MSGSEFAESVVEGAAPAWLEALGFSALPSPTIAVGGPGAEREFLPSDAW
ncbi:MAG: hypothetical protein ACRDIY_02380 [Chloroflexota bacterium]